MQRHAHGIVIFSVLVAGQSCNPWAMNNPDDPLRCIAPCNAGESCQQGVCQKNARCGDSKINTNEEECDGQAFGGASCLSKGFAEGSLSCDQECHIDTSSCVLSGQLVDSTPINIATAAQDESDFRFACGDGSCLTVWREQAASGVGGIFGLRLSSEGKKLDPSKIAIATSGPTKAWPMVTRNGNEYWIIWEEGEGGNLEIHSTRLADTGEILNQTAARLNVSPVLKTGTAEHACEKGHCLLAWMSEDNDKWNVYAARFEKETDQLSEPVVVASSVCEGTTCKNYVDVASTDENFLLVWATGTRNIQGARVSFEAALLDAEPLHISSSVGSQRFPRADCSTEACWVVWRDERRPNVDIYGARISAAGAVLDPNGVAISTVDAEQYSTDVACAEDGCLVTWINDLGQTQYHSSKYGARVTMAGDVVDKTAIEIQIYSPGSLENFGQAYSAYDGKHYWTLWQEYRASTGWDVLGARLAP
jgi:hypothetical protein